MLQQALVKGKLKRADEVLPYTPGLCPLCGELVQAFPGDRFELNVPHWVHPEDNGCIHGQTERPGYGFRYEVAPPLDENGGE